MKIATIEKCVLTGEWVNPEGGIVYYHQLTLSNGDIGNIGIMGQQYPEKISEGITISYTIDPRNKIKLMTNSFTPTPAKKSAMTTKKTKGNADLFSQAPATQNTYPKKASGGYSKSPADYLGFTWGYAKDLIVAGKTMADVDEMNKMARYIYDQIKDMLKDNDKA